MDALYGRAETLAQARALVGRAIAGEGRLLLFTGEPGIGKSRLAEQVALEAADSGALVAWGRCWEAGGAPAYWPWLQIFRNLELDEDPFADAGAALAFGTAEARFAAFDRAVRTLRAIAARRPLVLVLDDLHAADAPSLLLLLLLSHELPRSPLLVVGAYRDEALRLAPEIAPLIAKLTREAVVVPLARLGEQDVAVWTRDAWPEAHPARAAELYRVSEGQPLFVHEALRLARASDAGPDAGTAWSLGLRAVLDERLGRLSSRARVVLDVAAVWGREFSQEQVASAAELSQDAVHEALLEATATSIVVPGVEAGRFRFSHVLLRDRLYAELLPSARAALHVRAGDCAAQSGDLQAGAHHLLEGWAAGASERIAEVALGAARSALARFAFEDAARLARRCLALPDADGIPDELRSELEVVAGEALIRLGDSAQGKALCASAAARAMAAGHAAPLARAALAHATELVTGTLDPHMIALLRAALAALDPGDSALRSRVLARLCAALTPPAEPADTLEILELMRASLSMARRLGDPNALLYVLQFASTVGLLVPEQERFSLLQETLGLARALHQPLVLLHSLPPYLTQLIALGALDDAAALLPEYAELLGDSRQSGNRMRFLLVSALIAALRGDAPAAERLDAEARVLAAAEASTGPRFLWLTHRVCLAELHGTPARLASEGAGLVSLLGTTEVTGQFYGWLLAATGRQQEARARLRAIDLEAASVASLTPWDLHVAAETCVLLADAELAAELYPYAQRAADRMFWTVSPGAIVGPSALALGDLALLLGRIPEALRHYDAAIAACEALGSGPLIERCRNARAAGSAEVGIAGAEPQRAPAPAVPLALRREGDVWAITSPRGATLRIRHGKGFSYLQHLLEHPGHEVHVLELAGIEHRTGDAGPVLDRHAKAAYKARLQQLRDEQAEAERFGDAARASRAEQEIDAIAQQLAGAVGLGGRDRRAASDVERVRINVQRRLKDAIDRIAAADPGLGRYLSAAVKTGTTCVYQPL